MGLRDVGGVLTVLVLLAIAVEVVTWHRTRPWSSKLTTDINRFMYDWVRREGRVVIFTRDMSWVDGPIAWKLVERIILRHREMPTLRNLLLMKAHRRELAVVCPQPVALTDELAAEGAEIITQPRLNYEPTSRFTIVRFGRQDAEVAVGRRIGDRHVIERFAVGGHPTFAMAEDLVEVLRRVSNT